MRGRQVWRTICLLYSQGSLEHSLPTTASTALMGLNFVDGRRRDESPLSAKRYGNRTRRSALGARAYRTTKSAYEKRLAGRRRQVELAKDAIYEVERDMMRSGDAATNAHAQSRRDRVMTRRHLTSATADAYRSISYGESGSSSADSVASLMHATKSRIVSSLHSCMPPDCKEGAPIVVYDGQRTVTDYFAVQMDIMNALYYRGDCGARGPTLADAITAKLTRVLSRWMLGSRSSTLRQAHLHTDDTERALRQTSSGNKTRLLLSVGPGEC
jgi:hypothetical protein